MNSDHKLLKSEKTLELLRAIESSPKITQRDLSKKFGISLGKINFLLNSLLELGIIKVENFKNSKNKIGYIYILTPSGIKTRLYLTHKFFAIKTHEYQVLKGEIEKLGKEGIGADTSIAPAGKDAVDIAFDVAQET